MIRRRDNVVTGAAKPRWKAQRFSAGKLRPQQETSDNIEGSFALSQAVSREARSRNRGLFLFETDAAVDGRATTRDMFTNEPMSCEEPSNTRCLERSRALHLGQFRSCAWTVVRSREVYSRVVPTARVIPRLGTH